MRLNFGEADKRRIVEAACREGASISGVASKYGIAAAVMFRFRKTWRRRPEPVILPVVLHEAQDQPAGTLEPIQTPAAYAGDVERSAAAIEVELVGGRRVRLGREVDPQTVQWLVNLLEGGAS